MPSVDAQTGNLFESQGLDLLQSCHDRLGVERGTRAALPEYGFPFGSWPQLPGGNAAITVAIDRALQTDTRIDSREYNFIGNRGRVEVIVNSNTRIMF